MKKNKFFASFSVEKFTQIQQRRKRWQKKELLEDVDQEIVTVFGKTDTNAFPFKQGNR